MSLSAFYKLAICLVVVGNVRCRTEDGCKKGTSPFNSKLCVTFTEPGTWFETTSNCPFDSTNTLQNVVDEYADSPDIQQNNELWLNLGVEEVWMVEKDALLFNEYNINHTSDLLLMQPSSSFVKERAYKPPVLSRWRWQNSSNGACLSYHISSGSLNSRSCNPNDDHLKFPAVCWSLRYHNDVASNKYCPDGFITEYGLSSNCSKLLTEKDIGYKPTWRQATAMCSSLGTEVYLFDESQKLTATSMSHECDGVFLPLRNMISYAQLKLIQVRLFHSRYTTKTPEIVLMSENSTFDCVLCQTIRRPSQTLTLTHDLIQSPYLTLTVTNHDSKMDQSIACYTDASADTFADSYSNRFDILIQHVTSETDELVVYFQKINNKDKFYLRLKDGKNTFISDDINSKIHTCIVSVINTSAQDLKTLEIKLQFNSSGHYWCTGMNERTSLPMFTETVFLDLFNAKDFIRYSVLVIAVNFEPGLANTDLTSLVSSSLARVLHVTDGVIELKRITNYDSLLLFHVTMPSDQTPLDYKSVTDDDVSQEYAYNIVSVGSTNTCPAMNITGFDGESFELKPRNIDGVYNSEETTCVDVNSLYDCIGDGIVEAVWEITQEVDLNILKLNRICRIKQTPLETKQPYNSQISESSELVIEDHTENVDMILVSTEADMDNSTTDSMTNIVQQAIGNESRFKVIPQGAVTESTPYIIHHGATTESPSSIIQQSVRTKSTSREAAYIISNLSKYPLHYNLLPEVTELVDTFLSSPDLTDSDTLQNLETILTNMIMDFGSNEIQNVRPTVAILVGDLNNDNPVIGMTFVKNKGVSIRSIKQKDRHDTPLHMNHTDASAKITYSFTTNNTRLAFVVISNTKAFESQSNDSMELASPIVNIILSKNGGSTSTLSKDEFVDILFKPKRAITSGSERKVCAFWDTDRKAWSAEGCTLLQETESEMDVCRCNHLTHFAEIITFDTSPVSAGHQFALEIISIIGSSLSLLGLIIIIFTAVFREWRKDLGNQILLNLASALTLNLFAYLLVHFGAGGKEGPGCVFVGALLHYSLLAFFCWMLVMACLQVLRLITILGTGHIDHLLLKAMIFAWLVPLTFVTIPLALDYKIYKSKSIMGFERGFCYPTGTPYFITIFCPMAAIVGLNIILFILTTCRICSCFGWGALDPEIQRHGLTKGQAVVRQLKTVTFLFFLLGIGWTVGFLVQWVFFAYLFCIVATLQGFVIFVFFFGIQDTSREHWMKFFSERCSCCLKCREPKSAPVDEVLDED